ncbi:MAG TPA: DcaP family trimeric outer membrane transporter [Puia sp.]|nr:DcaP family trimeric outer membrane transporter [Puia sp.]
MKGPRICMAISSGILCIFLILFHPFYSSAQDSTTTFEIYGAVATDAGYNFNSIDPAWYDVMRPTKLPAYQGQFAPEGNMFFGVRQSKFGVKSSFPTAIGPLLTRFDFDMFGFGKDAGQTTIHIVNAYAQLGRLLVGQTASAFMDMEVFPVTMDYWGPASRNFMFNIQIRYTPIDNKHDKFCVALERPGATADGGDDLDIPELAQTKAVFRYPNLSGNYRHNMSWGYVQAGFMLKSLRWTTTSGAAQINLSGHTAAWGFNVSTVVNASQRFKFKFQGVGGEGIGNYFADVLPDIGLKSNADPSRPVVGTALPVWGFFLFTEIAWTKILYSSIGYSMEEVKNSDLQSASAVRLGQYGLVNLFARIRPDWLAGIEYQYGRRDNFQDHFHSIGNKIQFTVKINFSSKL